MKQRIFSGWNATRILYSLLGAAVLVSSIIEQEWWGLIFGGYFMAMGVFGFGCAAGRCSTPPRAINKFGSQKTRLEDVNANKR